MALTRVYGRVVYPHGEGTPTPATGDGVIEYVHATPGIIDGAVHGPDRKRAAYTDGVAEDAWLKPGMWRTYVYPDQGRSYTLHLGVPEDGETTIADAVGEVVPEGIVTRGEQGPPGEPGRDGQDGADGTDGHTPDITFDGTTIVVDGVPGPDLKGDPGEGGGGIAGAVPIFATLAEAQAWEAANPGKIALTLEGQEPVGPVDWEATAPTFDLSTGEVTIPNDEGATYLIDSAPTTAGVHPVDVPSTVTVTAVAREGYALIGQTEWVQVFAEYVDAYTAAALALSPQHYFAFDDGAVPPHDQGSGAGAGFQAITVDVDGPPLGVGSSSFKQVGATRVTLQSRPSVESRAFSFAAVIHPTAGIVTTVFRSWDTNVSFEVGNAWGSHRVQVKFPGMSASTQFNAPGLLNRRMHIAFTWDGAVGRAYMDGVELGTAPATGVLGAQAGTVLLFPDANATVAMAGAALDFTRAWSAAEVASLAEAVGA